MCTSACLRVDQCRGCRSWAWRRPRHRSVQRLSTLCFLPALPQWDTLFKRRGLFPALRSVCHLARPSLLEQAEIKKAYRTLALRCHPDKCPGDEVRVAPAVAFCCAGPKRGGSQRAASSLGRRPPRRASSHCSASTPSWAMPRSAPPVTSVI